MYKRLCVKPGCNKKAVASFTYMYSELSIVIGPLPQMPEPDAYEICEEHARNFVAPKKWTVIRLQTQMDNVAPKKEELDLLAQAIIVESEKPVLISHYQPPCIKNNSITNLNEYKTKFKK